MAANQLCTLYNMWLMALCILWMFCFYLCSFCDWLTDSLGGKIFAFLEIAFDTIELEFQIRYVCILCGVAMTERLKWLCAYDSHSFVQFENVATVPGRQPAIVLSRTPHKTLTVRIS